MTTRLDLALARRGLCPSRSAAAQAVAAGWVTVNDAPARKPGAPVREADVLAVTRQPRYVGRGGDKLAAALRHFCLDPAGCAAVDVGASTGGFTDCLLQHGARRVYAVDAGHGQLHPALAANPNVIAMEGRNARAMEADWFRPRPQIAVMDVSFISATLLLPALAGVLPGMAWAVVLVKPQFECGPAALNKQGVVKQDHFHQQAVQRVAEGAAESGFRVLGTLACPLPGGDGNREFLMALQREQALV